MSISGSIPLKPPKVPQEKNCDEHRQGEVPKHTQHEKKKDLCMHAFLMPTNQRESSRLVCSVHRVGIFSVASDGCERAGRHRQTSRMRRTSKGRSISHPCQDGGRSKNYSDLIGMLRFMDSITTRSIATNLAYFFKNLFRTSGTTLLWTSH